MSTVKVINQASGKNWQLYHGDSCEITKGLPDNSVGMSVFSPPFSSLYVYSNSERDMGNSRDDGQFVKHFGEFLVPELFRITKPGRMVCFHCMNLPMSKQHHGVIGLRDFRGELIRMFEDAGFIFHSEVCIWKDPVTAMQRTKAIGLLHKQIVKDSCMSRQGVPDYLVTMRKPGVNPEPVAGMFDCYSGDEASMIARSEAVAGMDANCKLRFSIDTWQRYASPVWMDINPSDTLQKESARAHDDERHICPLQLQVIERALTLWSNAGDVVFSPFCGIGSEGYQSIQMGRKFVGVELKDTYYAQAVLNLQSAQEKQEGLFEHVEQ